MRRIGIHGQAFVAAANLHQHVEIIGAHRGRAGMNFVREVKAELARVRAELAGLLHEAILAFLEQVVSRRPSRTPTDNRWPVPSQTPRPKTSA